MLQSDTFGGPIRGVIIGFDNHWVLLQSDSLGQFFVTFKMTITFEYVCPSRKGKMGANKYEYDKWCKVNNFITFKSIPNKCHVMCTRYLICLKYQYQYQFKSIIKVMYKTKPQKLKGFVINWFIRTQNLMAVKMKGFTVIKIASWSLKYSSIS